MGKARQIRIETRTFAKAGDATMFFKAMLNRYNIGDRVADSDAADLAALLKRHEEFDEKVEFEFLTLRWIPLHSLIRVSASG